MDESYINPRLAAVYDAECGWSEDRQFYLELSGSEPLDILDLGCGTGLIANAYARTGHKVVGVDPAHAMLELARASALGDKIEWVEHSSQKFRSQKQFDLIIMTGHAFQVLLEPKDVLETFHNAHALLKPQGRFVFETRNPNKNWDQRWNHERHIDTALGPLHIVREVTLNKNNRIWFDTHYHFLDASFVSPSVLRFWTLEEITKLLADAQLQMTALFGDWDRCAFSAKHSEELIFTAGRMA